MDARHFNPEKLKQARQERSFQIRKMLSQNDVAKALGVAYQTISMAERGKMASYDLLCRMAEFYDVSVTDWLYPNPKAEPEPAQTVA